VASIKVLGSSRALRHLWRDSSGFTNRIGYFRRGFSLGTGNRVSGLKY